MNYAERVLRYLTSIRYVQEVGPDRYAANKLTHILATPRMEAALTHRYNLKPKHMIKTTNGV